MKSHRLTSLFAIGLVALISFGISGPAQAAPPKPGPEVAIGPSPAGYGQSNPAVAWNGSVFLVVWQESSNGDSAIYGSRVNPNGVVLGGGRFLISGNNTETLRFDPVVASNGDSFMIVYALEDAGEYGDLYAVIVGGTGAITRSEWHFRGIDNDQSHPSIAWNGSRYLVVFEDTPDPDDPDIYAGRAFADGRSYDGCTYESCPDSEIDRSGIAVRETAYQVPSSAQTNPAVAARQGTFYVSWQDTDNATDFDIRGARLLNGVVLDAPPYAVSNAIRVQRDPTMAANSQQVFTAWTDRRSGTSQDVYADLGGTDFAVASGVGSQANPTVTTRGPGFLAAWTDNRSGNQDIYAARIANDGVVRDANGVVIAGSGAAESAPAVAAGNNNRQLVAYVRGTGSASRIMVRLLS